MKISLYWLRYYIYIISNDTNTNEIFFFFFFKAESFQKVQPTDAANWKSTTDYYPSTGTTSPIWIIRRSYQWSKTRDSKSLSRSKVPSRGLLPLVGEQVVAFSNVKTKKTYRAHLLHAPSNHGTTRHRSTVIIEQLIQRLLKNIRSNVR